MKNRHKNSQGPHGKRHTPSRQKPDQKPHRPEGNPAKTQQKKIPLDLYGFHAVREAWLNPERGVNALHITAQAQEGFEQVLKDAISKGLKRPSAQLIEKHELDRLLPGAVHQGLALACDPLPERDVTDLMIENAANPSSLFLILDQVTDPHNIGAILRSACAFGAAGIVMQKKHAPDLTGSAGGVLAKTACGALEHVAVAYETNLSRAIETLQEGGYFVYGLDERGEMDIGQVRPGGKMAIVLGAEGPGIRQLVKEHCDALIRLPMSGPMPSVNVSNAAAIALYALKTRSL